MGFYGNQILPRFLNIIMTRWDIADLRARRVGLDAQTIPDVGQALRVTGSPASARMRAAAARS
ncbi:MAG: hypothetical protein ACLPKE_19795 [Streptosporangiaceae bacterium]